MPARFTTLQILVLAAIGLAVLIQLVPYRHNHQNPAATNNAIWNNPEAKTLAVRACFDCHSFETSYPWYSNIAPVSWLVAHHIEEGRSKLNFSDWNNPQEPNEAARAISSGQMPPPYYTLMHASARLSENEKQTLIDGLSSVNR